MDNELLDTIINNLDELTVALKEQQNICIELQDLLAEYIHESNKTIQEFDNVF